MYNAELPALCHGFLAGAEVNLTNLYELITKVGGSVVAGECRLRIGILFELS